MPTGEELIAAIVGNGALMALDNCPGVPAQMSRAVYGVAQDDSGSGTVIEPGDNMQRQINSAVGFGGSNSETAVWHFLMAPVVHHFVVVPWYLHTPPQQGQVYTVFMAYENQYSVGRYVNGEAPAPANGGNGYKPSWTVTQLATMFAELLTSGTAWEQYFGQVGAAQAQRITYWKYKEITLEAAIRNVGRYP